jgi:hypothetical protein
LGEYGPGSFATLDLVVSGTPNPHLANASAAELLAREILLPGYDFAELSLDDYWQGQLTWREIIEQAKEEYLRDNPWARQFIS